jgi:hypothetical protein
MKAVPRIVRPMRADVDDLPQVGVRSKCLGVREPGNADIDLDESGNVKLNGRGLSVVADWRLLPGFLVPEHLEDEFNGASGRGLRIFVHGSQGFAEGDVAEGLRLQHKPRNVQAGNVTPVASVSLSQFQKDIQATRAGWVIDES